MEHQALSKSQKPNHHANNQKRPKPRAKASTSIHPLLTFQQSVDNQAMQRLMRSAEIQAKLNISQSGDKFEREADDAASKVKRSPFSPSQQEASPALNISRIARATTKRKDTSQKNESTKLSIQPSSHNPLHQHPQPNEEFKK